MFKKIFEGVSLDVSRLNDIAGRAVTGAKGAAEKLGSDIGTIKVSVSEAASAGADRAAALLDEHWSSIEHVLVEGLLNIAIENLKDDQLVRSIIEKAYETLPVGVRFVLPRDRYLELAFNRRDPLLLRLDEYRAKRSLLLLTKAPDSEGTDAMPAE